MKADPNACDGAACHWKKTATCNEGAFRYEQWFCSTCHRDEWRCVGKGKDVEWQYDSGMV